jgi:hypothetical protein
MSDQRKSSNYKVVVGDDAQVLKIVVGTPTKNVLVSNSVNLNDVIGITTSNILKGDILIADSDGILRNSQSSVNQIDGKVFNRDSDRGYILIRRSGDSGLPTGLRGGELAYSYLSDPSTGGGGNGGDRLYFGVGSDQTELASRIDVIGGKYFTDLLTHVHGINTPNTALIVDSAKAINELNIDSDLTVGGTTDTKFLAADSATIGILNVTSINQQDLAANLVQVLQGGEGIDITLDSLGRVVVLAEFATFINAGIVKLDSDQFSVDSVGAISVITNDGGVF